MIGPPVLRRRILKGSGQPDRERAAVLMEGGGNAFMSYMNFGDEQDRSSFPTDDLAAQCAFVLGHLPGCDTKHITAPTCARPEEDDSTARSPSSVSLYLDVIASMKVLEQVLNSRCVGS